MRRKSIFDETCGSEVSLVSSDEENNNAFVVDLYGDQLTSNHTRYSDVQISHGRTARISADFGQFVRECYYLNNLAHPGILLPKSIHMIEDTGCASVLVGVMVFDSLPPTTLADIMHLFDKPYLSIPKIYRRLFRKTSQLLPTIVYSLAISLLDVLCYLAANRVVHGDLHPTSVLVDFVGPALNVKLMHFHIAATQLENNDLYAFSRILGRLVHGGSKMSRAELIETDLKYIELFNVLDGICDPDLNARLDANSCRIMLMREYDAIPEPIEYGNPIRRQESAISFTIPRELAGFCEIGDIERIYILWASLGIELGEEQNSALIMGCTYVATAIRGDVANLVAHLSHSGQFLSTMQMVRLILSNSQFLTKRDVIYE
jgi:serine/threonine protein kinase